MITQIVSASRAGLGSVIVTATASGKTQTLSNVGIAYDPLAAVPPEPPVDGGTATTGGYTGGVAYNRFRLRKKRDELEELLEFVLAQQAAAPAAPAAPPSPLVPPPPGLIALTPLQRVIVKQAIVNDDDDDEAIALLLELLS